MSPTSRSGFVGIAPVRMARSSGQTRSRSVGQVPRVGVRRDNDWFPAEFGQVLRPEPRAMNANPVASGSRDNGEVLGRGSLLRYALPI